MKEIEGFPGYFVTEAGDVISAPNSQHKNYKVLKKGTTSAGYQVVVLRKANKSHTKNVHRLIAEAFLETVEGKPDVNHIDGHKANNAIGNLEWMTKKENIQHAIHTLGIDVTADRGRLNKDDVIYIRENYIPGQKGNKQSLLDQFKVSSVQFSRIINKHCWRHV